MKIRIRTFARILALAAGVTLPLSPLAAQEVGPPVPADVAAEMNPEGVEVMTRGVVHEAFAEVITDPKPGLTVSKRPPEAIDEVPPEYQVDEPGAIWIDGYWVWDDERDDFFWQSGGWRVPPPNMRWVAGYWNEVPGGWQWVSGFWAPEDVEEIRYLKTPPASLEAGPTSPSPGNDYFWATGSWINYDTGYQWQPGFWAPYRTDWVWVPARYVWTPAGCVYLPGRYDYRFIRRGCLFAPVYFTQPIYRQPNYVYRPWCALNTSNLFVHLWVRPNYSHFYFGNYYGGNWGNCGVTPWCQYRPYRNCYDPLLTQLQCQYRQQGVNYIGRLDGWHSHYVNNAAARPPRVFKEQVNVVNKTSVTNVNITNIQQNNLAVNIRDARHRGELPIKLARLDVPAQQHAISLAKENHDLRQQRKTIERKEQGSQKGELPQARLTLPASKVDQTVEQPRQFPPQMDLPTLKGKGQDDSTGSFVGRRPRPGVQVIDITPTAPAVDPVVNQPGSGKPNSGKADPGNKPKGLASGKPGAKPQKGTEPVVSRRGSFAGQPQVDASLPQPRIEPQPRLEGPKSRVSTGNPTATPATTLPPSVDVPRAKVDLPRERPQIRLDIPQPAPRGDTLPRRPSVSSPQASQVQPAVNLPTARPAARVEAPRDVSPRVNTSHVTVPHAPAPRMQSHTPAPQHNTPKVETNRADNHSRGGNHKKP